MIPNLVKGRGISGAVRYCMGEGNDPETKRRIELEPGQTSRSRILGGQGFGFAIRTAEQAELARRMMEYQSLAKNQTSKTRKCEDDCLHISLSWGPDERPSDQEMIDAAKGVLAALGMEDAKALFFVHTDKGPHMHIVASRIRPDGKTYSATNDFLKAQAWAIQWEIENDRVSPARALTHRLAQAVRDGDGETIIAHLTEKRPTFTGRELAKIIGYGNLAPADAALFKARILASRNIVGLHDEGQDMSDYPSRFTTVAIIEQERAILARARHLAQTDRFEVSPAALEAAAQKYTLDAEQRAALEHASGGEGFAMIAGQAGTGKSRAAMAIREAAEADGYTVRGLAWTNQVVGGMRTAGFDANTVAAELDTFGQREAGQRPCDRWDSKTILVIDEAAQLSTDTLDKLTAEAKAAGAKVIAIFDDKQFASIERGGLCTVLKDEHGAAEITQVRRITDRDQQRAWNLMHDGEFKPALEIFDKQGALHWTNSQEGAEKRLITDYASSVAADPARDRFIFAATNAEVKRLNEAARQVHRDQGLLGEQTVQAATKNGPLEIATGDRLQMNLTGTKAEKAAGIVKDAVGTVTAIDTAKDGKPIVTLQFDAANGDVPKVARFTVGEDRAAGEINEFSRGYAGTAYKGQGRSVDEVSVLHSEQWGAATSYVSLTRHKDHVGIYAARETVDRTPLWMKEGNGVGELKGKNRLEAEQAFKDWSAKNPEKAQRMALAGYVEHVQRKQAERDAPTQDRDQLARLMGRDDMKRAATGYTIDKDSYERSGLAEADRTGQRITPDQSATRRSPDRSTETPLQRVEPVKAPTQRPANENAPEAEIAASARYTPAPGDPIRDVGDAFAGIGRVLGGWAMEISRGVDDAFSSLFSPEPPPPPSPEEIARARAVRQQEAVAAERAAGSAADAQRGVDAKTELDNRLAAKYGRALQTMEREAAQLKEIGGDGHDLDREREREIDRGR